MKFFFIYYLYIIHNHRLDFWGLRQIREQDEFLSSLCEKAGLEKGCYKENNAKFFKYETDIFKEGEV